VRIHIPPLRERKEDLPILIPVLLARINRDLDTQINQVARDAMEALCAYDWSGNVRELENQLTKAMALCPGKILTLDLFAGIRPSEAQQDTCNGVDSTTQPQLDATDLSLHDIERQYTMDVLDRVAGHKGKACEILKISRPRLQRILERVDG